MENTNKNGPIDDLYVCLFMLSSALDEQWVHLNAIILFIAI